MTKTGLQYSAISGFLFDIEKRMDLPSWRVDGVAVWDYIRAPLHRKLLRKTGLSDVSADSEDEGVRTYLKGGYLWGRNLFVRNPLFSDCTVLSYGSARRKQLDDGYWWDIHFDPLYEETNFDYLHVEKPFQNGHNVPAKTPNLKYIDFIQYSGVICEKLGLVDTIFSEDDRERIATIEASIEETFGVTADVQSLAERKVSKAKVRKPLFDLLLVRTDPDVALMSVSYGKESFVATCKDRGIPVVELQHGSIDPYHPGYSFPGGSTKSVFPDYLLVWGEFWKENIEFPVPDENVIVAGYPHLDRELKRYDSARKGEQIVVISQPNVGGKLSMLAVELSEDSRVPEDVVYKLHPKEYEGWEERYPQLVESDVTVVDGDNPPLYQLLAESNKLVAVFSTVIYEGFNFGLETFLVDAPGNDAVQWLFDLDNVHVVDSVDEFVEHAQGVEDPIDATRFFAENPVDRLEKAITDISGTSVESTR